MKAGGDVPQVVGSEAAFEKFIGAARALPDAEVKPLRADLHLAIHNASIGAENVLACTSRIRKELPHANLPAIEHVPELGLALAFADTRIERTAAPTEVRALLRTGHTVRRLLLSTAESLVLAKLLPAREVETIRKGRGQWDTVNDCVALAALFTRHAPALRGKHAVTRAQVEECGRVGAQLAVLLKPGRARRTARSGEAMQQMDDRDRLWTLLTQGFKETWRVGAYLFGQDLIDEKVPPLLANSGGRKKKSATPVTEPATPV
jgi:hypothetical protein